MKIAAVIQARLGSTRLPSKVMMKIGDKTVLQYLIERLRKAEVLDSIIIATTCKPEDICIIETARRNDVRSYAGNEDDVLDRFIKAGEKFKIDTIVRICADNPLTDPTYIDELVSFFLERELDYAAYKLSDGTPTILTGIGLFPEVVSLDALKRIHEFATEPTYFEHVTNFIYTHSALFRTDYSQVDTQIEKAKLWLTVDTADDFEIISEILNSLYQPGKLITAEEIIDFVKRHPTIAKIMRNLYNKNPKKELIL